MYNEEYYLALLIKKEEIVKREFGQMPHEAIGISEEHYRNLKISSRYLEKPRAFDPRGQATVTPRGKI